MQLLGDVCLERVHTKRRRCNSCESKNVVSHERLRLAKDRIAERHVDAEPLTLDLAGKTAFGAEPKSVILHPFCLDLGMLGVGHDLERQEVVQIEASGLL